MLTKRIARNTVRIRTCYITNASQGRYCCNKFRVIVSPPTPSVEGIDSNSSRTLSTAHISVHSFMWVMSVEEGESGLRENIGIRPRWRFNWTGTSPRILLDRPVFKHGVNSYRVIQKEVYTFKNLFYKNNWTYGDVLYIDWRNNSQSFFTPYKHSMWAPRVKRQMSNR
jgi:hypothetical protein